MPLFFSLSTVFFIVSIETLFLYQLIPFFSYIRFPFLYHPSALVGHISQPPNGRLRFLHTSFYLKIASIASHALSIASACTPNTRAALRLVLSHCFVIVDACRHAANTFLRSNFFTLTIPSVFLIGDMGAILADDDEHRPFPMLFAGGKTARSLDGAAASGGDCDGVTIFCTYAMARGVTNNAGRGHTARKCFCQNCDGVHGR